MALVMIDVDIQHDFCAPEGALYVKGAAALNTTFEALTDAALKAGLPIVGSVDSHAFDAWEFAGAKNSGPNGENPGFPAHCVKGTTGWLKIPGSLAQRFRFLPNVPLSGADLQALLDEDTQQWLLEKEVYSLFANPNAIGLLEALIPAGERAEFLVYGVALDYCVKAAALGLHKWVSQRAGGGNVSLIEDATAAVDASSAAAVLEELREAGVEITSSTVALSRLEGGAA